MLREEIINGRAIFKKTKKNLFWEDLLSMEDSIWVDGGFDLGG
jgi:hypothetical protein